jgi:hypothetical protein
MQDSSEALRKYKLPQDLSRWETANSTNYEKYRYETRFSWLLVFAGPMAAGRGRFFGKG